LIYRRIIVALARALGGSVDMALDTRIVLVLLDLSLPSKNGWNTVEELRAQNPKP
jgi:DNA-binding response OmpR family regulator